MAIPIAITGQAGTGKTTRLMEVAEQLYPRLVTREHQSLLAMSFMHGSRRRLEQKLADKSPNAIRIVTTIDRFALSLVNRWRTSLGFAKPLTGMSGDQELKEDAFQIHLSFERIRREAASLVRTKTVGAIISSSYPLVVVDEFQDCYGHQLEFIKGLSTWVQLVVAADEFQLLDHTVLGCPAMEWISELAQEEGARIENLCIPRRSSSSALLEAAKCLRLNKQTSSTIPVVCCPKAGPAAWKIIEKFFFCPKSLRWRGACAMITPSYDAFVDAALKSCDTQLIKRGLTAIRWQIESSAEKDAHFLKAALGLDRASDDNAIWQPPEKAQSAIARGVSQQIRRFGRLRGIESIPTAVASRFAERAIGDIRAYGARSGKRVVTTIHGAKNREFDNVFVLWNPHTVGKWSPDEQRRLLYNAITRAKKACMVLVLGDLKAAQSDPVLSLLGTPERAFPKEPTTKA
jgi:hypothetical protein